MATTPISNLPPVNGLDGSELMVVVQSGITSRSTVQMVADRAQGLVPSGGLTGQVLTKSSDLDFALEWVDGGGGSGSLIVGTTEIDGGTNGRVLFDNDGFLGEYAISGTGNVAMTTSPVFTTPNLGTPSAAVLTNATGLPVATGVSGLGTGIANFLATPSSANLASAVTDETGTGSLVFATSPTLVTPNLGTPSALTLTNATGLPLSTGVTGTLPLANGGTGSSLSDPGADRIGFWDDSAGEFTWLTVGANLSITGTTLNASGGGGGADITIGSTVVSGGTSGRVLYDNVGVAGEYAISGTGSVAMTNSPVFTTPNLGTPSAATLTNATGLPISTGVSGLGTGVATFLATPSSANLASAVTDETGSGSLVFATSPTLVTPTLGTPASGTLTNCTGLPISSGVSGLGTGVATFLATPSSANLKAAVTDETGSGALVFATSPTLVTPALGTPSAAVLTNATGLPLATGVTGQLPVAKGGTAASTLTAHGVLLGQGTSAVTAVAPGTSGYALTANGGSSDPIYKGFVQPGTGASTLTWQAKAQQTVHAFDFGAAGNGSTDDTAALQAACDYLATLGGGILDITGGRFLIDSADLSLPANVFIQGPWWNFGFVGNSEDYSTVTSALVVNSTYTVRLNGSASGIKGVNVLKKGLTTPTTLRQAYNLAATFSGTGITLGSGVTGGVTDNYIGYCFIAGFAQGIQCEGPSRPHMEYISGDNTAGIHISQCFDMNHLSHVHLWPFLTAAFTPAAYTVSGAANNGSGLIRITVSSATVLQTGDIVTIKNVGGVTAANGRWTVTVIDTTHFDLQGSAFAGTYTSGGTTYFSAWRRTGTGILFDDIVDWGQADTCFTYGYDNGITIDDSNHTTLINCGCDNYATAADPTTVGIWITGTSEMCSLESCKTAAMGSNLKIDTSSTNSDAVSVTNHRSWGAVTYLAQCKDGTPKFVNCQWATGGIIRVESTSGQPAFFGGDLTGVTFSYAAAAPIASSYDVDGTTTKIVAVENTNATSNRIAYYAGNNSTPANADNIYASYFLNDSTGVQKEAFRQTVALSTVTSGSENSQIFWGVYSSGVLADKLLLAGNANCLCPVTSAALDLGVSALPWNRLYTASQPFFLTGVAPPAGGSASAGLAFSSTANLGLFFGSGAPTFSAAKGSLYLNTTATTTTTRLYINSSGSTTWATFTASA